MVDVNHFFGEDLSISATGDLLLADQSTTGVQRVYRRLLTNPQLKDQSGNAIASPDYTWHPTYGAGVPRKIGSPGNVPVTTALIRGQMLLESAVARSPTPKITLTQVDTVVSAVIKYTDAQQKTPQFLEFDITK
jgi:hypothetical protein